MPSKVNPEDFENGLDEIDAILKIFKTGMSECPEDFVNFLVSTGAERLNALLPESFLLESYRQMTDEQLNKFLSRSQDPVLRIVQERLAFPTQDPKSVESKSPNIVTEARATASAPTHRAGGTWGVTRLENQRGSKNMNGGSNKGHLEHAPKNKSKQGAKNGRKGREDDSDDSGSENTESSENEDDSD